MIRANYFWYPWSCSGWGGKRAAPVIAVALVALLLAPVVATGTPPSRAVLEQKVRLLESYFASATVAWIDTANDPQAKSELEQAKGVFAEARALLANGDLERAASSLDEALRKVSSVAAAVARTRPARTARQEKLVYDRLRGQIESYMNALGHDDPSRAGGTNTQRVQERLGQMLEQAKGHAQAEKYRLAKDTLTEAYRVAVVAIAVQRKGETAVFRLSFETPADEYLYERKRNDSYEMLVGIMMNEKQSGTGGLKAIVERMMGENRSLRERADAAAHAGDYSGAIATMEGATSRLVRALRAGGLPVPE